MFSGTVSAGLGFSAATVPLAAEGLFPRLDERCWLWVVEMVRLRDSSDSIFFRIAYSSERQCEHTSEVHLKVDRPHLSWTASSWYQKHRFEKRK